MKPEILYLADDSIDEVGDRELRDLLTTCFRKPQDHVFETRRYFKEPYKHRWVIRSEQGALVAHVGVHDKMIEAEGKSFRIGGICEVCVHPDYRGRRYVKAMLDCIHIWLSDNQFQFSLLFGDPKVYGSSGYVELDNLYVNEDGKGWKPVKGMMKQIMDKSWPDSDVQLVGIKF
jgi:predicted acetyltransferase